LFSLTCIKALSAGFFKLFLKSARSFYHLFFKAPVQVACMVDLIYYFRRMVLKAVDKKLLQLFYFLFLRIEK